MAMTLVTKRPPSLPKCTGYGPHKRVDVIEEGGKSVAELAKLGKDSLGRAVRKGKEGKADYIAACAYFMDAEIRMNSEGDTNESKKVTSALSEFTYRLYVACESRKDYRLSAVTDTSCTARKWLEIMKQRNFGAQPIDSARSRRFSEISEDTTSYTDEFVRLLEFISSSCVDILGRPPCDFSHVLLGELGKSFKFSALESMQNHYVVLSNDIDKEKVAEYFDWYFTLLQCILLGVSESLRKCVINRSKVIFQNEVINLGTVDDITQIVVQRCRITMRAKLVQGSRKIYEKFISGSVLQSILKIIAEISNGAEYLEDLVWCVGKRLSLEATTAREIVKQLRYLELYEEKFLRKLEAVITKSSNQNTPDTDTNDELRKVTGQLRLHVKSMIEYPQNIKDVALQCFETFMFRTAKVRIRADDLILEYTKNRRKMKRHMQYVLDPVGQQESLADFIEIFTEIGEKLKEILDDLVLLLARMRDFSSGIMGKLQLLTELNDKNISQGSQGWEMDTNACMKKSEQEKKISVRLETLRQCAIDMLAVVQNCQRGGKRGNPTKLIDQLDYAEGNAEKVLLTLASATDAIINLHADNAAIKYKLSRKQEGEEKGDEEDTGDEGAEGDEKDGGDENGCGDEIRQNSKTASTKLEILLRQSTNPKEVVEICQRHDGNDLRAIRNIMVSHEDLNSEAIKDVSAIIECCDHAIELEACDLEASLLNELHDRIKSPKCQIAKFTIGTTSTAPAIMSAAVKFAKAKRVRMLCMDQTDFSAKSLDDITERTISPCCQSLFDSPFVCLTSIDISHNKNIDDFSLLGKALWNNHILHLRMVDCDLQNGQMVSLRQAIREGIITNLNISYNENLTEDGYSSVCGILNSDFVESLKLGGCELSHLGMTAIRESLAKAVQIDSFDVSYNGPVSEGWIMDMGMICKNHNVRRGSIAGCDLSPKHMGCLEKSLKQCQPLKLMFLDLSDNPAIRSSTKQLGNIVKDNKLQEFSYADCMLTPENVLELVKGLDGYKVKSVDLSDWERSSTVKYVEAVQKLIPLVERDLKLCFADMNEECRAILQNSVDRPGSKGLKILLSESSQRTIEMTGFTIVLENGDEVVQTRNSKFETD